MNLKKRVFSVLALAMALIMMIGAVSCGKTAKNAEELGSVENVNYLAYQGALGTQLFAPSGAGESAGGYERNDSTGTKVEANAYLGTVGDLSSYVSISDVLALNDKLYVADETGKHIYRLSLAGVLEATYTSTRKINGLATDGTNIYSLEGALDGTVVKLSASLTVASTVSVGHTPTSMVIANGKGFVTNRFSNNVSVINLSGFSVSATVDVDGREPMAATSVGNLVYIACHLADETSNDAVASANVVILSAETNAKVKTIDLINGASGVKDICVTPDGETVYVSHVIGRYTYPVTQMDRGWINTNGFSVIDTATQTVTCAVLLDEVDRGAANPWGITVSADGKYLAVALSGVDEVMVIDLARMNEKIDAVATNNASAVVDTLEDISSYLTFLNNCRTRIEVGVGARSLVEYNGTLYCGLYYDGVVSAVTLSNKTVKTLTFAEQPEASLYRQGQILWNDATDCYQNWQSCSSCHPDTSTDGLFWDFSVVDRVSFNTKSPIMAFRTPPVTFSGGVVNAEEEIILSVYGDLYNASFTETQYSALNEYLKGVLPTLSPELTKDGILTDSAIAGKELFEKNCASCHPAPFYTDLEQHNVGTDIENGAYGAFDTPSLIEAWRTGPYMHDGSLGTIEEVVEYFAPSLADKETEQLADYVRSLCSAGEAWGVEQVRATDTDGSSFYNLYKGGATLAGISVRRQTENAPAAVVVALNVYDANGKQVYYADSSFGGIAYNTSVHIVLGNGVVLPEGGYYTVSIYDYQSGELISSPLTVK